MAVLIRNARVITAGSDSPGDILVVRDRIARVAPAIRDGDLPGSTRILDASGLLAFPGFVDPHVHIHLPAGELLACEDHSHASRSALLGGTTTVVEMVCTTHGEEPLERLQHWQALAAGKMYCDYSFHAGLARFDGDIARQMRRIVEAGVPSFKVLLAYKDSLAIPDRDLFNVCRTCSELGALMAAHCENAELIAERQREFIAAGRSGPEWHERSRPAAIEADGVHHLLTTASLHGTACYIVHTSCRAALEVALSFRSRGQPVFVESVLPHLALDESLAAGADGERFIMSPPLRGRGDVEALWAALAAGEMDTVGTDHAPFDTGQKSLGRGDFTRIPNGLPSLRERIPLLYTLGVAGGRITACRLVEVASTRPAKLLGLFPRKGDLAEGSDADIVLYNPSGESAVPERYGDALVDYSPYASMPVRGRVQHVLLRGEFVVENALFTAPAPGGKFLARQPSDYRSLCDWRH